MKVSKFVSLNPLILAFIVAVILVVLCGLVIFASKLALPDRYFQPVVSDSHTLSEDQQIAAWTSFDKDSYHIGEIIHQELRIIYQASEVVPDIDSLRRRLSFFPLEQRSLDEITVNHSDGVVEHILEYQLQGVRVEPQQTYEIEPFILYYSNVDDSDDNIYSQVIQPEPVHIAAYYPASMLKVSMQPLKGMMDDAEDLRQYLLSGAGVLLLLMILYLLWHYGRRRSVKELAEEERLWRVYKSMDTTSLDNRTALLNYEQIFTRLLHHQTGVSPEDFWSGMNPEDVSWHDISNDVRALLLESYQPDEPPESAVSKMKDLLGERLSTLVSEKRLIIEQGPTFSERIRKQPGIISAVAIFLFVCIGLFTLAANPGAWISGELQQYNSLMSSVSEDPYENEQIYLALSAMGDSALNKQIQTAALFNAGTLRGDKSFSMSSDRLERHVLNAVLSSDSVEELFHALLEEPFTEESQIVTVLVDGAEQLRRAQLDLQAAVRINPGDTDTQRNLEISMKRREIVLRMLNQIRAFYRSQNDGEEQEAMSDEGIINLLEAELPEDEEEENTGKDDRGYMILERF